MFKYLFAILGLFLTQSFHLPENESGTNDLLVSIDIEANMKKMEIINLSQFTNNIKYVPLENKEDLYFANFSQLVFSEDLCILSSSQGCLLYDTGGHFISRIGRRGRGPGEYQSARLIGFDSRKNIYLRSSEDLFEFQKDGSFVNKYSRSLLIDNKHYLHSGFMVNDSMILGYVVNSTGQEKYRALIINKQGDIKYSFRNYELFKPDRMPTDGMEGSLTHYYRFNNSIFYKELYNDTLFSLSDKYELIPRYAFNFGRFKEPLSSRAKFIVERDMMKYMYISFVYHTEEYLFLDCNFGNQFPVKRLTPMQLLFGAKLSWYTTRSVLGIYDKRIGKLIFCKPTSTDNPLFTSGIYNDIDAGPRFFPTKQVNDSTMVMWVTAKDLKDHIASNDFKNNIPKYPTKKKEIEKLANSLSEFDNPVLMFVTIKNLDK